MIPKVIHYCHFGRKPKSKLALKCIKSWHTFCPDYEIKEWNEDNFDVNQCLYSKQAYENKQFAFVADYARVKIVADFGGIYLDTDVELLKPLDDLLSYDFWAGTESPSGNIICIGLGFGAVSKHRYVQKMLADYECIPFIKADGSFDRTTGPLRNTATFTRLWEHEPQITQVITNDNEIFFPRDYLNPRDFSGFMLHKTKNTRAIHWGASSWMTKDEAKYAKGINLWKRRIYCLFQMMRGNKTEY